MPTALTPLGALSVPATVDLREMESTVQVSPTVRIFFFVSNNLMFFCLFLDINECASDRLNDCDENARCIDTIGSYNCTCNSGYEGDGFSCTG